MKVKTISSRSVKPIEAGAVGWSERAANHLSRGEPLCRRRVQQPEGVCPRGSARRGEGEGVIARRQIEHRIPIRAVRTPKRPAINEDPGRSCERPSKPKIAQGVEE